MPPCLRCLAAQARSAEYRRSFPSPDPNSRFVLTGTKASVTRVAAKFIGTYGGYSIADVFFGDIIRPIFMGEVPKETPEGTEKVSGC